MAIRARHKREERTGRPKRPSPIRSVTGVRRIAWAGVSRGAKLGLAGSLVRAQWDVAPKCARPYVRTVFEGTHSRNAAPREKRGVQTGVSVEIATPCRRCEACLVARRRLWSARARSETAAAPETWFGTLTFRAELQHHWLSKCREDARADGVDFDALTCSTQFTRRLGYAGKEARKYIGRIRHKLPAPIVGEKRLPNLRYLLVAERHTEGADDTRPHFHVLFHSIHASHPIPLVDRVIQKKGLAPISVGYPDLLEHEWEACGFSSFKRVTERNCTYLCKYLQKDADNRVRASEQYGAFEYSTVNALSENALMHNLKRTF